GATALIGSRGNMTFLDFREPVSAWSHALWLLLSIPATLVLWRRCGDPLGRRISFLVFGLGLASCYLGSAAFHGVRGSLADLDMYDRFDHVGIFLLIAGSYTPIAWNLMCPMWRRWVLGLAWGAAALGSLLYLVIGVLPIQVGTAIYLVMGWGALFCYLELARRLSQRRLFPLMFGGVLYSVGAVINLAGRPVFWPGVFGSHELFHVFVMAGSVAHYLFMLNVVIPACRVAARKAAGATAESLDLAVRAAAEQRQRTLLSQVQLIHVRTDDVG
ncbi:MAG TPA: hemolysin III family protein, partial [Isosphaeraceae bacterium]